MSLREVVDRRMKLRLRLPFLTELHLRLPRGVECTVVLQADGFDGQRIRAVADHCRFDGFEFGRYHGGVAWFDRYPHELDGIRPMVFRHARSDRVDCTPVPVRLAAGTPMVVRLEDGSTIYAESNGAGGWVPKAPDGEMSWP